LIRGQKRNLAWASVRECPPEPRDGRPPDRISVLNIDFDLIPARLIDASAGERALLYSRIFWPSFVEIEGMVFLEGTFEDESDMRRLREAIERYSGDPESVEESFNFHELDLLFGGLQGTSAEDDDLLAERLTAMWKARLRDLFSNRQFLVEVVRPDPSEGHELGVVFHEHRA
jgi:hypothetical protein